MANNLALAQSKKRRIGEYTSCCRSLLEYEKNNPNIDKDSDLRYSQLEESRVRAAKNLISLSPTAKKRYPDPSRLPIINEENVKIQDVDVIFFDCMLEDARSVKENPGNLDIETDNLVQQVTISAVKKDKHGNPILFEQADGSTTFELEDITIFSLKGNNMQEVSQTIRELANNISNNALQEIETIKEDLGDFGQGAALDTEEINRIVAKQVSDAIAIQNPNDIEKKVLQVLATNEAQRKIVENVTLSRYSSEISDYVQELAGLHLKQEGNQMVPKTLFGQLLLSQNLSFVGPDKKKVQGDPKKAITEYITQTVEDNLASLSKSSPEQLAVLLNNLDGSNKEANRMYHELLDRATGVALTRLANDNIDIPQEFWQAQRPGNKHENPGPTFQERLGSTEFHEALAANPRQAHQYLMSQQGPRHPQLPAYMQPQPPTNNFSQSLPSQETQTDPYEQESLRVHQQITDIPVNVPAMANKQPAPRAIVLSAEDKI